MAIEDGAVARLLPADCLSIQEVGATGELARPNPAALRLVKPPMNHRMSTRREKERSMGCSDCALARWPAASSSFCIFCSTSCLLPSASHMVSSEMQFPSRKSCDNEWVSASCYVG